MARKTEEQIQETRQKLIDAARICFLDKGIATSSLEEVAQIAGMTRGAIYSQFPKGRKDLLDAVFLDLDEKIHISMTEKSQSEPNAFQLELFIRWWLESLKNRDWLRQKIELSFQEMLMNGKKNECCDNEQEMINDCKNILKEMITQSYHKKEIKLHLSINILSMQIISMLLGATVIAHHNDWSIEQIEEGKSALYAWLENIKSNGESK